MFGSAEHFFICFDFQSRFSGSQLGRSSFERHLDFELEKLEKDFPINFTFGAMEASQLQGQVRGHSLRQPQPLRKPGNLCHSRTGRHHDYGQQWSCHGQAASPARTAGNF